MERFKEGTCDRLGICLRRFSIFIIGHAIAFYYSWQLTLVVCVFLPFMAGCTVSMNYVRLLIDLLEIINTDHYGFVPETNENLFCGGEVRRTSNGKYSDGYSFQWTEERT